MSFPNESLPADQLEAAYFRSSFDRSIRRQLTARRACDTAYSKNQLVTAYCRKSFEQQSLQQDELQLACLLSPTRASQLISFEQKKLSLDSFEQLDLGTSLSFSWFSLLRCSRSTSDSFNQLDLAISLSLPKLGSTSFSYQLSADSFDISSFEHRAFHCTALLHSSATDSFRAFSLQGSNLVAWSKGELSQLCRQELSAHLCNA